MAAEKFIVAVALIIFAWIPTGGKSAPVEQNQIDIMAFRDQLDNPQLTDSEEVEDDLANLLMEFIARQIVQSTDNQYQTMPSSEQYEDDFFNHLKRGKGGRRAEGGRSNRRGATRSTTMHSTVGLGKRGNYKQGGEPFRPKPLLTWRH